MEQELVLLVLLVIFELSQGVKVLVLELELSPPLLSILGLEIMLWLVELEAVVVLFS